MKRLIVLGVALVSLAGLSLAAPEDGYGPGPGYGRGPGMMGGGPGYGYGRGPGMMGGGPGWDGDFGAYGGPGWGMGMMGGGLGWDYFDRYGQLPADKRAKLRDLAVETQRKMVGFMAGMHELMLTYRNALARFPVDKSGATAAWDGMTALRKQMFEARLEAVTKAQEIVGKELWESLDQWGPPPGRAPRGQ